MSHAGAPGTDISLSPLRLIVASTWDGAPIPPREQARVSLWMNDASLHIEVDAPFHDDPPPPGSPGPCDELWTHEVVELFVVGEASEDVAPRYTEIELSPHGHHLALELIGVRQVARAKLPLEYRASIAAARDRWRGRARLDRTLLPPPPHRLNACAIHGQGAARRYLAVAPVPGPTPDFHRLDGFPPATIPVV